MARMIRDAKLETRKARDRLPVQKAKEKAVAWRTIIPGKLALGYKKTDAKLPGLWVARRYIGKDKGGAPYRFETIGFADDYADADGERFFSYSQAFALAGKEKEPAAP